MASYFVLIGFGMLLRIAGSIIQTQSVDIVVEASELLFENL